MKKSDKKFILEVMEDTVYYSREGRFDIFNHEHFLNLKKVRDILRNEIPIKTKKKD